MDDSASDGGPSESGGYFGGAHKKRAALKASADSLDTAARQRFERLRAWRLRLTSERALPAFCILHDSTMLELARSFPKNMHELREVAGIGPAKAEEFGEALLAELRK